MKYICEACFDIFSGSISDMPGTVLPTIPQHCDRCGTLVTPGVELSGHMVIDFPAGPVLNIVTGVSGSR